MRVVRWYDGKVVYGATWRQVEDAMRASSFMDRDASRHEYRRALTRRVARATGICIGTRGTSRGFIRRLAAVGIVTIIERERRTDDPAP